jgi:uncharacterized protein involved in exopolysaccharide biosynthesis
VTLVLIATLFAGKTYSATTTVVFDIKNADPVSGVTLIPPTTASYLATQVGVINSSRVIRRVIDRLALDRDPSLQKAWQQSTGGVGDYKEWLSAYLLKHIGVRTYRDGNLMDISATWSDPAMASRMANALAQAYIDTNLELKVEPAKEYAGWFGERT